MRIEAKLPPRAYTAGFEHPVTIRDCGTVYLDADEQVTFVTASGGEYDVARKEWGFYATPSTNGRLASFGLRALLARNRLGRNFVLLVEKGHEDAFEAYRAQERLEVVAWLDTDDGLCRLKEGIHERP